MIDRAREIRSVADVRNAVNGQPAFTLARGCSGRFVTDNKMLAIGLVGGSVFVESLTMIAKMAQMVAVTADIGASHDSGNRYTKATPTMAAIAAETAVRFIFDA
jgi:hypothetical protein